MSHVTISTSASGLLMALMSFQPRLVPSARTSRKSADAASSSAGSRTHRSW